MKKFSVGWGIVPDCNMRCSFCYSRHRRGAEDRLPYEALAAFVDENHDVISAINYGTGENTLSPTWFRLIEHIRSCYPEITQALTTNGYLSQSVKDPEHLAVFRHAVDEVDVSLDFADADRHNKSRGRDEATAWALETLALCQSVGKRATIVFLGCPQTLNPSNIEGLFAIAQRYDAILRMNIFRPTRGVQGESIPFIASREQITDALRYIAEHHKILAINDAYFSPVLTGREAQDDSGTASIRVLPDGTITPSTYLISKNYAVDRITTPSVLHKQEVRQRLSEIVRHPVPEACHGCLHENSCAGGVYDRRYLWHGTLAERDPYCDGKEDAAGERLPLSDDPFRSVHDGYLPTMFFKP